MIKTLSARAVEIERRTRENEVLREKQVTLTIDLDKALKREAEARRKQEESRRSTPMRRPTSELLVAAWARRKGGAAPPEGT